MDRSIDISQTHFIAFMFFGVERVRIGDSYVNNNCYFASVAAVEEMFSDYMSDIVVINYHELRVAVLRKEAKDLGATIETPRCYKRCGLQQVQAC